MTDMVDLLSAHIKGVSDTKLSETFISALKLSQEQRELVEFVFWLCYMSETDLESVLIEAWEQTLSITGEAGKELAERTIIETLKGYRTNEEDLGSFLAKISTLSKEEVAVITSFINKNYKTKAVIETITELPYFTDKIKVYEALLGKSERTSLYYAINDIRNALSHHRLDELTYKGRNLLERGVKEEIILDYFRTAEDNSAIGDITQSAIWKLLDEPSREAVKRKIEEHNNSLND